METLYDEYDLEKPNAMPMNRLYRSQKGPFPGRVAQFAGITPGRTSKGETKDVFNLWLSDLETGELECYQTSREGLRDFCRVMPKELDGSEQKALESRARAYATMCMVFADLSKDPDAGKGPEHFCGPFSR